MGSSYNFSIFHLGTQHFWEARQWYLVVCAIVICWFLEVSSGNNQYFILSFRSWPITCLLVDNVTCSILYNAFWVLDFFLKSSLSAVNHFFCIYFLKIILLSLLWPHNCCIYWHIMSVIKYERWQTKVQQQSLYSYLSTVCCMSAYVSVFVSFKKCELNY